MSSCQAQSNIINARFAPTRAAVGAIHEGFGLYAFGLGTDFADVGVVHGLEARATRGWAAIFGILAGSGSGLTC